MGEEEGKVLNEMSDSLLRQRRNLIITCILLLLVKYIDKPITKITIFSNDYPIQNFSDVKFVLWIVCIYFFLRFYQRVFVEKAWKQIIDEWYERIEKRFLKYKENKQYPNSDHGGKYLFRRVRILFYIIIFRKGTLDYAFPGLFCVYVFAIYIPNFCRVFTCWSCLSGYFSRVLF